MLNKLLGRLVRQPIFWLGLVIKLVLMATVVPVSVSQWYAPFMAITTNTLSWNPWQVFLDHAPALQETSRAFPYGYAMWLWLLPATLLAKVTGLPLSVGYGVSMLVADAALLVVLAKLLVPDLQKKAFNRLLGFYWLSPIVLVATYWLGYNDGVPVCLLTLAIALCQQHHRANRLVWSGLALGLAISAKLSMLIAVPFFGIYLIGNKALRPLTKPFLLGLGGAFALVGPPFMASGAGVHMLLNNPEMGKIYQAALPVSDTAAVYLLPLVYLGMVYVAWRVRRMNGALFMAMQGLAFLMVALLTPASPGWFLWMLPMLMAYQLQSGRIAIAMITVFSALFALVNLNSHPTVWLDWTTQAWLTPRMISLCYTAMVTLGLILAFRLWRDAVRNNDYFQLSRKPFVIGIAGDSGAGKDTLADALTGLFGSHSVASISGDDYHLWDRHKPMWQVMTHLNPLANDLESFTADVVALSRGKTIQTRHYNHKTGKMSRPFAIKSNDFIIASGLHALYGPVLRDSYHMRIYLDIDESLRQYLKIKRDVHQRGHSLDKVLASLEKRQPDSAQFIRPQAQHADLVMSLQPIHPRLLNGQHREPIRYKLAVRCGQGLNELSLMRVLVGLCGLHVDATPSDDGKTVDMVIEGETTADDIAMAARMLFPRVLTFLDRQPAWQDGVLGQMQLVTLAHIDQSLSRSLVC
jgi:uridine kinase